VARNQHEAPEPRHDALAKQRGRVVSRRVSILVALAGLAAASPPAPAEAYEFWTRARTSGEAYELRGFRLLGDELTITRRRFTQSLALVLHDLGDLERDRLRDGRAAGKGVLVSWRSYLRLDHDFGTFITGRLETSPTRRQDALDVIPELEDRAFALSLLYGHLSVDGLLGGRLSLQVGRIAAFDATGALPIDGVAARAAVAAHVEVRASAGLAVRDSSWLSASAGELDGTSGADCQEYVEAAAGQPGSWRLLDRGRAITDGRYTSDFEYCPQRAVRMPTAQLAVASRRLDHLYAEAGYRIARSPTVGLIGEKDRLEQPDLGLYPDEDGQAPGWGTNLEQLYAVAQGRWRRGALAVEPRAFVRASLVEAVVDRAELEVAFSHRRHQLSPSVSRFVPSFDADSIWSAFGAEPSLDLALDYRYRGPWHGRASLWARRYDAGSAWAWGAVSDATRPLTRRLSTSARALGDGGFGGERLALHGELRWSGTRTLFTGRGALAWVRGDSATANRAAPTTSGTAAATATVRLAGGVAVHSMMEMSVAAGETAIRALGIVDFALESDR
jgi:hypothetical protein